jgi:chorismate-pyruvate lyase
MNITESPIDLIAPEEQQLSMIRTSSLGDIMNSGHIIEDEDDENHPKTLSELYDITHPLDRIALTANGNLQRIVASYYDAPVTVQVIQCSLRTPTNNKQQQQEEDVWDRVVHLCIHDRVIFCVATSVITVHDQQCRNLVASGTVGIGQLFRYLNILPEFHLHGAGKIIPPNEQSQPQLEYRSSNGNGNGNGGGGFWRNYTLSCPQLTCRIHEEFIPGLWEITKPTTTTKNS